MCHYLDFRNGLWSSILPGLSEHHLCMTNDRHFILAHAWWLCAKATCGASGSDPVSADRLYALVQMRRHRSLHGDGEQ